MIGLIPGDAVNVKGTITEVNPNGTYTVELPVDLGDDGGRGFIALMIPTESVTFR